LERVVVWVDPAVTSTDQSDAHGIQADGIADDIIYRLYSWEGRTSPDDVIRRAILKAVELGAECVGVETDQGGDTWQSVYDRVWDALVTAGAIPDGAPKPLFRQEKAGAGHGPKAHRASQMLAAYERGEIVHVVGTHGPLEAGLRRFPLTKPFDLADAAYWAWHDLAGDRAVYAIW
jgi:phage terminase large subunit-like protein